MTLFSFFSCSMEAAILVCFSIICTCNIRFFHSIHMYDIHATNQNQENIAMLCFQFQIYVLIWKKKKTRIIWRNIACLTSHKRWNGRCEVTLDHMHQRIFHIRNGVVNSIGDANYADHICFHEMRFVLNCNAKSITLCITLVASYHIAGSVVSRYL